MIDSITVQGLGAMGLLFASRIKCKMPEAAMSVLLDSERIERYREAEHLVNGKRFSFELVSAEEAGPADLAVTAVKSRDLDPAMEQLAAVVKEGTIVLSLLNGVTTEKELQERFPEARVVTSMSQGMDATRVGRELRYTSEGLIVIGQMPDDDIHIIKAIEEVADFLDKANIPYEVSEDMPRQYWGKWMLNCGVNQAVAFYEGTYATVQRSGSAREHMIAAMKEAAACSTAEGIPLSEKDIAAWVNVVDGLNPDGIPSMRQDQLAGRPMELDLFSAEVIKLGRKHGIPTPVNDEFFERLS